MVALPPGPVGGLVFAGPRTGGPSGAGGLVEAVLHWQPVVWRGLFQSGWNGPWGYPLLLGPLLAAWLRASFPCEVDEADLLCCPQSVGGLGRRGLETLVCLRRACPSLVGEVWGERMRHWSCLWSHLGQHGSWVLAEAAGRQGDGWPGMLASEQ